MASSAEHPPFTPSAPVQRRLQAPHAKSKFLAVWWGAFLDDELLGDMGLFFSPSRKTGRFQSVETAPAHQRKGVCRTLLSHVARNAFEHEGTEEIIIVTDVDSIPESIYRSLGFQSLCPQRGLCRSQ